MQKFRKNDRFERDVVVGGTRWCINGVVKRYDGNRAWLTVVDDDGTEYTFGIDCVQEARPETQSGES